MTLVFALALAGCNAGSTGDTGAQGPAGPAGPPGPAGSTAAPATALNVTINSAKVGSGTPVVKFTVTDQNGVAYPGIPASNFGFTIAELIPGTNGDTDHWQNYVNEIRTSVATSAPEASAIQPSTDSGGTLVDNNDGTYTYTFGTDITNVTTPKKVTYDPADTQRVTISVRSSSTVPVANNGVYDWQPSTGTVGNFKGNIPERLIADTFTYTNANGIKSGCDSCHTQLSAHGSTGRRDVRVCVTCHNPGNSDPNTGESLDFRVMIHKIHDASNLPSFVNNGTPYEIYGYMNHVASFTNPPVQFPQDIRNCTKCHNPADPATPDAANYKNDPSIQACGSCHDNVDFATGTNHAGGVQPDNSQCTLCHLEGGLAPVTTKHEIKATVAAAKYQFNILSIKDQEQGTSDKVAPGDHVVVTFSVTDPTNNNTPYDLKTAASFTTAVSRAASLGIDIGWSTSDYTNAGAVDGSGNPTAEAYRINVLTDCTTGAADCVDNGDGTYTVTSGMAIPSTATGSGVVGMEGHPWVDFNNNGTVERGPFDNERIPVTAQVKYFAITDSAPVARRAVVDVTNCEQCHGKNDSNGGLSHHGNSRTDNVQLCVICHNPDDTDRNNQYAIDFKRMIHGIHDSESTGYHVNGEPYNTWMRFPGEINKCTICHTGSTYQVPLGSNVLASTQVATTPGVESATDKVITPTASVCSACHVDQTARAHMAQNGAGIATDANPDFHVGVPRSETVNDVETCGLCHGSGAIEDVDVVHGLK